MIASSASIVGDLGVFPLTAVKFVIGRAFVARADAEQRAEGVKRVEPAVKAERELIEVGLQMLRADVDDDEVALATDILRGTASKAHLQKDIDDGTLPSMDVEKHCFSGVLV